MRTVGGKRTNRANKAHQQKEDEMTIKRDVNGIVDYCLSQVEAIDERHDIDIDKKVRYGLAYLKELRGFVSLGLHHKKLMIQAPNIAKDPSIVLSIGTQNPSLVQKDDEDVVAEEAPVVKKAKAG